MNSSGNPVPVPVGTEISILSAEIGKLGLVDGSIALTDLSSVEFPDDFPGSFVPAQVGDASAFEDGSHVKVYYRNEDRDQVGYEEPQDQQNNMFYGDQGYDTVRIPAFSEEFSVEPQYGGTLYTHPVR